LSIAAPAGAYNNRTDHPFGGLPAMHRSLYARRVILLEIGLLVAIIAFFIVLDLYVRGCEYI
jgi:hypothetical protein